MNTKSLKNYIRKLRITDRSIVAVLIDNGKEEDGERLVEALATAVKCSNLKDVSIIKVTNPDDIKTLDFHYMNKLGWFHRDQIESLFTRIAKAKEQKRKEYIC